MSKLLLLNNPRNIVSNFRVLKNSENVGNPLKFYAEENGEKEKSIIFLSLPIDFLLSWISSLKVAWHRWSVKTYFSGRKREFTFSERDCITSKNFSTFSRDRFAMKNNECRGFNSFSFRLSPRRWQAFAYYFRPLSNFYVWFIILKLKLITLLHTESATLFAKAITSTQHSISQLK